MNRDKLDVSKLLGFDALDTISGGVDFQDDTLGAKLGAKVGEPIPEPKDDASK